MFRSDEQVRMLVALFVTATEPMTLTALARRSNVSVALAHKEVELLEGAGLVKSTKIGQARMVEPDEASPLTSDLRSLLTKAFGPPFIIGQALDGVSGIEQAFIFGSWAESHAGTPTGGSNDIDLMVIGDPDVDALYDRLREVETRLGLPVNATLRTPQEWLADDSGFAERVRNSATIPVL